MQITKTKRDTFFTYQLFETKQSGYDHKSYVVGEITIRDTDITRFVFRNGAYFIYTNSWEGRGMNGSSNLIELTKRDFDLTKKYFMTED